MTSLPSNLRSTPHGKKPQLKIGRYTFGHTVGHGTFSKVKLAKHELTGHQVAVKILNKQKIKNLDVAEKIHREILILKLFRHPHIIKLYEVIPTATDLFLILEYVAGGELFDYIVKHGKSSEKEGRVIFQQIIAGVDYCHRHKVVHRDLKPENILLDSNNQVKIADFGLSNIIKDGELLKTSCGSPNYAAPEVVSGKLYGGPEVDVWSCGIILYALLCGSLPFDDINVNTLFKKIRAGHFKVPTHLCHDVIDLITSMLQVNPLKRISIQKIKEHPWFIQDLPDYLFPQHDAVSTDSQVIDPMAVSEVCQKIGVGWQEVAEAVYSGDPHNQLNVAYHLILDSINMRTDVALTPISSSFQPREWVSAIKSGAFSQLMSPARNKHPPLTPVTPINTSSYAVHLPALSPSYKKKSKWHLGIRSQSRPQDIMTEIFRKMKSLDYSWKAINPYHVLAQYRVPGKENLFIKLDLQLYQIDQRNYLLDLKNAHPSAASDSRRGSNDCWLEMGGSRRSSGDSKPGSDMESNSDLSLQERRHYTMEFFEITSLLIQALSQ